MFKPRSRPPVAGGAFFSWGSDRAAAEPKSGAVKAPADKRLNSRLEKPHWSGSLLISSPRCSKRLSEVTTNAATIEQLGQRPGKRAGSRHDKRPVLRAAVRNTNARSSRGVRRAGHID